MSQNHFEKLPPPTPLRFQVEASDRSPILQGLSRNDVNLMPFAVLNEFPSDWKTRAEQKCYGQLTVIVPCVADLLISKLKRGEPRDKLHAQWASQLL